MNNLTPAQHVAPSRYILFLICLILAPILTPLVYAVHRWTQPGELELLAVGVAFVAFVVGGVVACVVGDA